MPGFAPALSPMRQSRFGDGAKGGQAFSAFAPFRVGANKGRKCRSEANLNSYHIFKVFDPHLTPQLLNS